MLPFSSGMNRNGSVNDGDEGDVSDDESYVVSDDVGTWSNRNEWAIVG